MEKHFVIAVSRGSLFVICCKSRLFFQNISAAPICLIIRLYYGVVLRTATFTTYGDSIKPQIIKWTWSWSELRCAALMYDWLCLHKEKNVCLPLQPHIHKSFESAKKTEKSRSVRKEYENNNFQMYCFYWKCLFVGFHLLLKDLSTPKSGMFH